MALVEAYWLNETLADPKLRILDCSVKLTPHPETEFVVEDCFRDYLEGHIPGAAYIDLFYDLSDRTTGLRFTLPSLERFTDVMSKKGIGPDSHVVCYARREYFWATRLWWMFRCFGFHNVAVLNGGWENWVKQGFPIAHGREEYPETRFVATFEPQYIVDKNQVLEGIEDPEVLLVNALSKDQHLGRGGVLFTRPGHIPSSVNVPARSLVDSSQMLLPDSQLKEIMEKAGLLSGKKTFVYCGGGISATGVAFALARLGVDNVAVYDGSLNEWGKDIALPMKTIEGQ